MDIDIIVEGTSWDDRDRFPYDDFREVLSKIGVYVGEIRFLR